MMENMEDTKKSEIEKNIISEEQPKELSYCQNVKDNNKSFTNDGYNMESNYSSEVYVHLQTTKMKNENMDPVHKYDIGNCELNKEITSANNNDDVDTNLPTQSNNLTSIDNNFGHPEPSEENLNNDVFTYMQYPLCKPQVNPASNEFNLIEDENLSEGKNNLVSKRHSRDLIMHLDQSIVISNSNLEPLVEHLDSNNYSLAQLATYKSDESLNEEFPKTSYLYREPSSKAADSDDSDSDSSSSSSSTSVVLSDSSDAGSCEDYDNCSSSVYKPIKTKGELELDDLPPIEDLKVSVPEDECIVIGKVFQIVDKLVVIQAMRDKPAYDLDTVLFTKGGQPLGKIFDVFGPVAEPFYSVRFNSTDHIKQKNITLNQMVYSAPKTKFTKFVFVAQLMKIKGSDASWTNDEEPPEMFLDYSDDEQEQKAKKKQPKNKKAVMKVDLDPDEPARKKHFAYERRMNERNLKISANKNHQNPYRTTNNLWPIAPSTSNIPPFRNNCHEMFGNPPIFNSRIPPTHAPYSDAIRSNVFSAHTSQNASTNVIQSVHHSQRFMTPNNSQMLPSNCSLENDSGFEVPNCSFSPSPVPHPIPFRNQSPNSNWNQLPFNHNNVWPNPHSSSTPSFDRPIHTNNRLPSSAFWIQRPTLPLSPNIHRPYPGLRNSMYIHSSPPRAWPIQNLRNSFPSSNRLPLNYIPYPPPPSPNPHNF